MDSFTIKRGDTRPAIRRFFSTDAGPLEIPGGSTVVFSMADALTGRLAVDQGLCQIEQGKAVVYYWQDGDTAVAGLYQAEFEITYADGTVETAPNGGFIVINITPDIA